MIELGLIGYPLGHSFSQAYFERKFREEGISGVYRNMAVEHYDEHTLAGLFAKYPNLDGFNVTSPWKRRVMADMDVVSEEGAAIGGVNVVKVVRWENGKRRLEGYNSDWIGFQQSIPAAFRRGTALVVGSGGAAAAAVYALRALGMNVFLVSRMPGKTRAQFQLATECTVVGYDDLCRNLPEKTRIIVNATPLGTWPATDACPDLPYHLMDSGMLAYDMVYNPAETLFMRRAAAAGAQTLNGLQMLHRQAEAAWSIWI